MASEKKTSAMADTIIEESESSVVTEKTKRDDDNSTNHNNVAEVPEGEGDDPSDESNKKLKVETGKPIPNKNKEDKKRKKKSSEESQATEKTEKQPKKQKKPRVKPEKVQEVYKKIIEELVKSHKIGVTELSTETLALAVGYKHPRSDAVQDALKLLKKDGILEKNAKTCKFTEAGIEEHVPETKPAASPEEALEQFWGHYEMKLASSKKSSGEKVLAAAKVVWNMLKSGKAYTPEELVAKTGYSMTRSTGFEQVMQALKQLDFTHKVEGSKKVAFTDKLFPFGRPE